MGIVTFTTDFGDRDGYVAAMKGVVLAAAPDATLVDVSHAVPRGDVEAAAFVLAQAAGTFPPETIHVAVVDPGVGGARAGLVIESHGSYYVGPDNGVLSLAARGPRAAFRIDNPIFLRSPVSATFHGRDVFASTAARLLLGHRAAEAGPEVDQIAELARMPDVVRESGGDSLVIRHVDHFGNLITQLSGDDAPTAAAVSLTVESEVGAAPGTRSFVARRARTYEDVAPGELVLYVGSGGAVEIGVRNGSAALVLGVTRGARLRCEPVGTTSSGAR